MLEKLGVPVYYADTEARRLMNCDSTLVGQIVKLFGTEAYKEDSLNRDFLAKEVFGDPEMLAKLNAMVHPLVRRDYTQWLEFQTEAPYVVEEAAILFESGVGNILDGSVLVYAPEWLRIQRVILRDGVDEVNVRRRMMHQMDEEDKMKLAEQENLKQQIINYGKIWEMGWIGSWMGIGWSHWWNSRSGRWINV